MNPIHLYGRIFMTTDEVIELLYKGDVKLYEKVIRNTNQHVNPHDPNLKLSLSWKTIQRNIDCYPAYEEASLRVIENFLYYLPASQIYIPHQPFIKALIALHQRGELTEAQLVLELDFHCKRIRNDDMKKYGWARQGKYEQVDYDLYETHLGAYKQKARQRLIEIICCEPPLECSLGAEIYLRNVFLPDDYHDKQPYTIYEKRAVTIGAYREALLDKGPEAADDSLLYGVYLSNYHGVSPYTYQKID